MVETRACLFDRKKNRSCKQRSAGIRNDRNGMNFYGDDVRHRLISFVTSLLRSFFSSFFILQIT